MEETTRIIKTEKYLDYRFSEKELLEMSKEMARTNDAKDQLERRKKEAASDFSAQIKAKETIISDLSRRISNGYEYRDIQCEWHLDDPEPNLKTLYRVDTGEMIQERPMADEDRQIPLDLSVDQEAAEPEEVEDVVAEFSEREEIPA